MKETDFARYLTRFLSVYLPGQVGSKRNTQLAYRDSFSLFLRYCRDQENISPEKLILSILVDTFISKISLPMQPVPEIGSISVA